MDGNLSCITWEQKKKKEARPGLVMELGLLVRLKDLSERCSRSRGKERPPLSVAALLRSSHMAGQGRVNKHEDRL